MTQDEYSSSYYNFQQFKAQKLSKKEYKWEFRENEINDHGTLIALLKTVYRDGWMYSQHSKYASEYSF